MPDYLDPKKKQRVIDLLNDVTELSLKFQKFAHQRDPIVPAPVTLDDEATSLFWAAALAENVVLNNGNYLSAVKLHDKICDQVIWPDPGPMPSTDIDDLLVAITMWLRIDLGTFGCIATFYPIQITYQHPPRNTIHELMLELAVNAIDFMKTENSGELADNPVNLVDPPNPPNNVAKDPGTILDSLHRIELAMHKFVQIHMQFATFLPAHLRLYRQRTALRNLSAAPVLFPGQNVKL